jgi:hypothetical protein
VNPNYQRQEVGLNLIKSTIDEAFKISNMEQIEIDVPATNTYLEKLCQKIVFQLMDRMETKIKKFDCHLMQCQRPKTNLRAIKFHKRIRATSKYKERFFLKH